MIQNKFGEDGIGEKILLQGEELWVNNVLLLSICFSLINILDDEFSENNKFGDKVASMAEKIYETIRQENQPSDDAGNAGLITP